MHMKVYKVKGQQKSTNILVVVSNSVRLCSDKFISYVFCSLKFVGHRNIISYFISQNIQTYILYCFNSRYIGIRI